MIVLRNKVESLDSVYASDARDIPYTQHALHRNRMWAGRVTCCYNDSTLVVIVVAIVVAIVVVVCMVIGFN